MPALLSLSGFFVLFHLRSAHLGAGAELRAQRLLQALDVALVVLPHLLEDLYDLFFALRVLQVFVERLEPFRLLVQHGDDVVGQIVEREVALAAAAAVSTAIAAGLIATLVAPLTVAAVFLVTIAFI